MSDDLKAPEGVPPEAWVKLAVEGKDARGVACWRIPERSASGEVTGTALRYADGRKGFVKGGARGILAAWPLDSYAGSSSADPVLVAEGASDTAALMGLGFDAVGIPMARACADSLRLLLADRHAVIVADNDDAGLGSARALEAALLSRCASVRIILPPNGAKDARAAVIAGATREDFMALIEAAEPIASEPAIAPAAGALRFDPVIAPDLMRLFPTEGAEVIGDLLREGETMNLVSGPKVRKSFLALSLALSVVTGQSWLGRPTLMGRVLMIDAELKRRTLSERLRKVQHSFGATPEQMAGITVWSVRGRRLSIEEVESLLREVQSGEYRLIVIDPLYRFTPTGGEENSNDTMRQMYDALDAIAERTGAAVVIVHHASKGSQSDKAITDVGAGAGAQSRAADTHLVLRPHQTEGAVVAEAALRSLPPVDPFVLRWNFPRYELAPDLDPADLKRFGRRSQRKGPEVPAREPVAPWTPERFAAEVVGETPIIRDEVTARGTALGLSKSQCESLLRRAEDARQVHRHQGGASARVKFSTIASVPDLLAGAGGGPQPPSTPGATAPGGMGGLAHPPSPLPKRGKGKAA